MSWQAIQGEDFLSALGKYISLLKPLQIMPQTTVYNRKGWHSVILQGTLDHEGLFIDITPAGQAVVKLLLSIIIIIII